MKKIIFSLIFSMLFTQSVFAKPDIDISYNNGIYHIVLKGEKIKRHIKFVASDGLITNKEAHQRWKSYLTVNAGFFDPKTADTISYIVTDRNTSADPVFTQSLFNDVLLRKNIDKILNRSEFRVIECNDRKNNYRYEIMPHKSPIDFSCNIVTSAQGGPLVWPELKMEEEFFIDFDEEGNLTREAASVLHKTSRTIIALKDGEPHILIITDENPMTLIEVHELCGKLGFDRAMAFDGGSSTSMNYLNKYNVVSLKGDGAGRSLKSFLVVTKEKSK